MKFSIMLIILSFFYFYKSNAQAKFNYQDSTSRWSFEYHFGGVLNAELPLTIVQQGYPNLHIKRAVFYSDPFTGPHYWDWRFVKWFKKDALSFEAIHHKIFLTNKPPEIQRFGISHGYNMLVFCYTRNFKHFNAAIGSGSVLMHPESKIRDMQWPEGPGFDLYGYRLRGYVINLALSRQFRIYKRFYINTEAKVTFSQANAPIVNGYAKVNSLAYQFIFGPGIDWGYKKKKTLP